MGGTVAGGLKARETMYKLHGRDFYANIGRIGGKNGHTGGFASNPELAKRAGSVGGKRSKRGKAERDSQGRAIRKDGELYERYKTRSFYQ